MKKLTLDETWELCLKMWKWINESTKAGSRHNVRQLKEMWTTGNGFVFMEEDCFFCEYDIRRESQICRLCPGKKVDKTFKCENPIYHYENNPIKFYEKLVELNKIRLAKKGKK